LRGAWNLSTDADPEAFVRPRIPLSRGVLKKKAADLPASRFLESLERDYFVSFFGLHFSQVLPSFAAFWQHLCSHSLPAAFALSQQDSARTVTAPRTAIAQAIATSDLIAFICFTFCLPVVQTGG
jgi:hypothetical protein